MGSLFKKKRAMNGYRRMSVITETPPSRLEQSFQGARSRRPLLGPPLLGENIDGRREEKYVCLGRGRIEYQQTGGEKDVHEGARGIERQTGSGAKYRGKRNGDRVDNKLKKGGQFAGSARLTWDGERVPEVGVVESIAVVGDRQTGRLLSWLGCLSACWISHCLNNLPTSSHFTQSIHRLT
jgi:hypothetical protein